MIAVLGEPEAMSGEAASRAHLGLPGRQSELLEALAATGKPVILVLVAGRPLDISRELEKVPSALMAWYLGNEGGPALAEILFGDINPSGKLPVSWPRSVGQIPIHYNRLPTGRPTSALNRFTLGYMDESIEPLFPFGFGLSYTSFRFSDLVVPARVSASDTIDVRVAVTNTGERAGEEVVQLYVRDVVASRSRPLRELKAFEKLALAPGQSRIVTLKVPARELGFHLDDGTYVVEPGRFDLWVGADSRADLTASFELVDGLRLPPGQRAAGRAPSVR